MSQMQLILRSPIEELIPQMIAFNNKELMSQVNEALQKYEGIVYTDDNIALAKKDKAELNKFTKALNDERIRIRKLYEQPYNKFKDEVDEVINLIENTTQKIDKQIVSYTDEMQAKKLVEIKDYYNNEIGQFANFICFDQIHEKSYLNSSKSMKSIKEEIDVKIAKISEDINAIESLNSENESTLKAFYFRTLNLSAALIENDKLNAEKSRIIEAQEQARIRKEQAETQAKADAEAQKQEQANIPTQAEQPEIEAETVTEVMPEVIQPKIYTFRFEVQGTLEQMNALKACLQDNKIQYSKI